MERNKLVNRLQKLNFIAIPTVATEDMGLQYDYIMSEGAGTGFGGMGTWPAYRFNGIPEDKWLSIRQKLKAGNLQQEDLKDTSLESFGADLFDSYYGALFRDIELNDMLKNVLTLPENLHDDFYCLFDMGDIGHEEHRPDFYETEDQCLEDFKDTYCFDIKKWEDMGEEELEEWAERIDTGEFPQDFLFIEYNDDNEG